MLEDRSFTQHIDDAVWIASKLFDRGKATGSTSNISFKYDGKVYMSASGACFARLKRESFAEISLLGERLSGPIPSKELPLHLMMYNNDANINAVIHTHSIFSVLWSCLEKIDVNDAIPRYTPYLSMKLGKIKLVPYSKPGSQELFKAFSSRLDTGRGYLLANHGPVVAGNDLWDAFYSLEELEESAKIAWSFRNEAAEARLL